MWIADQWKDYEVLDTSSGEKLERWGDYLLVRPDPQVIWNTPRKNPGWKKKNGQYHRSSKGGEWEFFNLPEEWSIHYRELTFRLKPFSFKHTGLFPEQATNWDWFGNLIANAGRPVKVLNLFAYTGGATLSAAKAGAAVTHVDASKGMVTWAKENAAASGLSDAPIRWLVDDCVKFVEREIRRGNHYDGIIMDPPSYGRGPKGEIWKIEESIYPFIELTTQILSALFPDQLLYNRSTACCFKLYDADCHYAKIRRTHRSIRNRTARYRQRTGAALRCVRTLEQTIECTLCEHSIVMSNAASLTPAAFEPLPESTSDTPE